MTKIAQTVLKNKQTVNKRKGHVYYPNTINAYPSRALDTLVSEHPSEVPLTLPLEKTLSNHSAGTCNGDLVRAGGARKILKENRDIVRKAFRADSNFKSVCNCGRNVIPGREVEIWERARDP
ncbi:unnamed protein product, partial [marine sediment metagenome]